MQKTVFFGLLFRKESLKELKLKFNEEYPIADRNWPRSAADGGQQFWTSVRPIRSVSIQNLKVFNMGCFYDPIRPQWNWWQHGFIYKCDFETIKISDSKGPQNLQSFESITRCKFNITVIWPSIYIQRGFLNFRWKLHFFEAIRLLWQYVWLNQTLYP